MADDGYTVDVSAADVLYHAILEDSVEDTEDLIDALLAYGAGNPVVIWPDGTLRRLAAHPRHPGYHVEGPARP